MTRWLRFPDLVARGLVKSRPQLKRMQQHYGFPLGRMITPNVRAWTDEEVDVYEASRPTENTRPLQGSAKAKHERRKASDRDQTTA